MKTDSTYYRIAVSQVATNLTLGIIPLLLLALVIPSISLSQTLSFWICLTVSFMISRVFAVGSDKPSRNYSHGWMRMISCMLLGTSLIAIFWKGQNLPHALEIIILSFSIRWFLFIIETRNLILADRQRQPLPSFATRIRRIITFITGAVIPLFILIGSPPIPLLTLSFCLTAFAQWAIAYEVIYNRQGLLSLKVYISQT
ncbi:MAG: hypothetical protein V4727_05605 [Verrucomicrobiota bacterium]